MDALPIEILENIFTRFSQRHAVTVCSTVCKQWYEAIIQPYFFSSIEVYSEQQLERCIQMAKQKYINNKPVGHYIQHLKFQFEYFIKQDKAIELINTFPNIHSTRGLTKYYTVYEKKDINFPQLEQITYFAYWYTYFNRKWMKALFDNNNNKRIKSIEYVMDEQISDRNQPIYLQTINQHTKLLVLPTLNSLKNLALHIHRTMYTKTIRTFTIDERTFESIHKSCPQLESLTVYNFYMDISDEYDTIMSYKPFLPDNHLKHFSIQGLLLDPRCYTYFSTKYPHLASLTLDLQLKNLSKQESFSFKSAIYNMITQYTLLKKLILSLNYLSESDGNLYKLIINEFWPHNQLLQWLQQHPTQICELEYPPYEFSLMASSEVNEDDLDDPKINWTFQQPLFLNHLTTLSIYIHNAVYLGSTYLLHNTNTIFLSSSIERLTLQSYSTYYDDNYYIYDWLDMFPNLKSLTMILVNVLKDDDDQDTNNNIHQKDTTANMMDDYKSDDLHQILQQRKQLLGLSNENTIYKLRDLNLRNGSVYFKNGFRGLFKKCQHIKQLNLNRITYYISESNVINEAPSSTPLSSLIPSPKVVYFDWSFLYLEFLSITFFYLRNLNSNNMHTPIVTRYIINETLVDSQYKIIKESKTILVQQYTTIIKCKYIEGSVFH